MKINKNKTNIMVFNQAKSVDILPEVKWNENELEVVEQTKLEELISLQPDRSVKSYQLCWTEIRWRIEQLSVGVTKMNNHQLKRMTI